MHEIESILQRIRSDDSSAVHDLLRDMASFIYKFPAIRRRERIVEAGEFYEYTVSKIMDGCRLKSYDPGKGNFYLFVVDAARRRGAWHVWLPGSGSSSEGHREIRALSPPPTPPRPGGGIDNAVIFGRKCGQKSLHL